MEYTTIEFNIPVGSEEQVKNLVSTAVENFIIQSMLGTPITDREEFKEAVDNFRGQNNMNLKYSNKLEVNKKII